MSSDDLPAANASITATDRTVEILGTLAAGLLVATIDVSAFYVDAATFAISATLLATLPLPDPNTSDHPAIRVIAAETTIPVIGVPIPSTPLNGLDSLLAIVQMPAGIPVGTTAIGKPGATNAGILAAQIIGLSNTTVAGKLKEMKGKLVKSVEEKSQKLQQMRKR